MILLVLLAKCLALVPENTEAKSCNITVGYENIALRPKVLQKQSKALTTIVISSWGIDVILTLVWVYQEWGSQNLVSVQWFSKCMKCLSSTFCLETNRPNRSGQCYLIHASSNSHDLCPLAFGSLRLWECFLPSTTDSENLNQWGIKPDPSHKEAKGTSLTGLPPISSYFWLWRWPPNGHIHRHWGEWLHCVTLMDAI